VRYRVDPNWLTIAGFIITVLGAGFLCSGHFFVAGMLISVAGTCDFIDGKVARKSQRITKFGDVLDDVLDRYSDVVLFGAAACYAFIHVYHVLAFASIATLAGALMTSFIKAIGTNYGFSFRMGAIRRQERVTLLVLGLLTGFTQPFLQELMTKTLHTIPKDALLSPVPLTLIMCFLAIFTNVSTLQRFLVLGKLVKQLDIAMDQPKVPEGLVVG
jgi:CDP-diacylglycerol--glycerol-3-phosphate 3-phosphatidyltransferase